MAILHSHLDRFLIATDTALRTIAGVHGATRPIPKPVQAPTTPLTPAESKQAAALMRVNHVGEVCAQALYNAQALTTRDPHLREHFIAAAEEETDHLAWTKQRVNQLGGRLSLLNPLWYMGAFAIGMAAGRAGDRWSLGFVVETERQVEQHLNRHLEQLPQNDMVSRAIVQQMRDDEIKHAHAAERAGGKALPAPIRGLMRLAAKIMTTTAHYI